MSDSKSIKISILFSQYGLSKTLNYLLRASLTGPHGTVHVPSPDIRRLRPHKMHIHEGLRDSHQATFAQSPKRHDRVRRAFDPLFFNPLLLQDLYRLRNGSDSARRRGAEHRRDLLEDLGLPLCGGQARPGAAETGNDEARQRVLAIGLGAGVACEADGADNGVGDAGEVQVAPPGRGVDEESFGVVPKSGVGRGFCFVGWEDRVERNVAVERCGR